MDRGLIVDLIGERCGSHRYPDGLSLKSNLNKYEQTTELLDITVPNYSRLNIFQHL